jgi:Z1 domain/Type III restriction enzyme, res subunit
MTNEIQIVDKLMSRELPEKERSKLWESAKHILNAKPEMDSKTGLALGYVQSGKTTQMIALTAAAFDAGYRIVIALLGSTNLLLDQNDRRFKEKLDIENRNDFRWITIVNPKGSSDQSKVLDNLAKDRVILISVLKHAMRINNLAEILDKIDMNSFPVLILDDEADQHSLNPKVNQDEEGKVYESIGNLRNSCSKHMYVQFTATPYAQLLLEPDDRLSPDFVEFLHPGDGYIGGREFFIDYADKVIRTIPALDEQPAKGNVIELPKSLVTATANFIAGSALLLLNDPTTKRISMLVHSTHRNPVQERYHFLLKRLISNWREISEIAIPSEIYDERSSLVKAGAVDALDKDFDEKVRYVLKEIIFWLLNSVSSVKKVNWNEGPIHILVGGNKLDRGFTVEGLTVTYMNRPHSDQIDTLEQRARAFGYRSDLLPYCQFFATQRSIRMLRGIVHTEYDLRGRLADWIAAGNSPKTWAREIGMLLPKGARPTRANVFKAISAFNNGPGWHSLKKPSLSPAQIAHNQKLVAAIGLPNAPRVNWGRIEHRTLRLKSSDVYEKLLKPWQWDGFSPGWEHEHILQLFESMGPKNDRGIDREVTVIYMQLENKDEPRERTWSNETGFINLLQGKDIGYVEGDISKYPGDGKIPIISEGEDTLAVQVHRIQPKDRSLPEVLTLAVYLGDKQIVKGIN